MTEEKRQEWNTAVAAAAAAPDDPDKRALVERLKGEILGDIHTKLMAEDQYQERTR